MKILVTGGCGYIGSHTCVELLEHGYEVIVVDNLVNSKRDVIDKIKEITGKSVIFYEGNVQEEKLLVSIFKKHKIDAVIHFAGLKAVGESVKKPILYYQNNLDSTLVLLKVMEQFDVKKIIFSSSATVYGSQNKVPFKESDPVGGTTNPYGTSKLFIEHILEDLVVAAPEFHVVILRYFNPIGAHKSGLIGDNPNGIPNNLMPYITKVASGELEYLNVFGNDYPTKDGTGVRDYIHVVDLADGHVKALDKVTKEKGIHIYNLVTGIGYSVLEIVSAFEAVNQIKIPYVIKERRDGDIAECYADVQKAKKELGFQTKYGIQDMVRDSYQFYIKKK
ncbi:MAG: UDP-glucose 4-epimerase GalE [Erysipelotrichaceae bacterium]|nr:UDP-glucose 4-epimerase GalE [Erysipelotrichaceae bacterium]